MILACLLLKWWGLPGAARAVCAAANPFRSRPWGDFPAPGPSWGRKTLWGGEKCRRADGAEPVYAAMVSKSSFALLLAGFSPSTASKCSRASSLRPR